MPRGKPKPGSADVSALVERGFTRLEQGKLREARADFDEALRRGPTNGRAFFGRYLVATTVLIVWAAGKIVRTGLLMQGKGVGFRELVRWVRA